MSGILGSAPVKFASAAEIKTGTEAKKVIAPDKLLAATDLSNFYESAHQTITAGGQITLTHGLGRLPRKVEYFLRCYTADLGYSVSSHIKIGGDIQHASDNCGVQSEVTSTEIRIQYGSLANVFRLLRKDAPIGQAAVINAANWKLYVRVFA